MQYTDWNAAIFRSRPLLVASLTLNLAVGTLSVLFWQRLAPSETRPIPSEAQASLPDTEAASSLPKKQSFHWSQLDSPDFRTFVRNLRGIGCPEATIRDIVAGELADIYAEKRQQAGRKLQTGE